MKPHYILFAILFVSSQVSALCTDGRIGIEIHISEKTMDIANTIDFAKIPFNHEDSIFVYEDYSNGVPKRKEVLNYGYISADGFGNFEFKAVSFVYDPPINISIDFDHEVSYEEGLDGYYRNRKGQDFNLNSLRCNYFDLGFKE